MVLFVKYLRNRSTHCIDVGKFDSNEDIVHLQMSLECLGTVERYHCQLFIQVGGGSFYDALQQWTLR